MVSMVNVFFLLVWLLFAPPPPRVQPFFPTVQQFLNAGTQKSPPQQPAGLSPGLTKPLSATVVTQTPVAFVVNAADRDRTLFYHRVTARSLGEGSFALAEIACTMKNRLRVSRAPLTAVLRAYHAADVSPAPAQIEIVRQVFEGQLPCPETWWYALSLQDTYYWRPHQRPPAKTIKQNDRKQILIFDR